MKDEKELKALISLVDEPNEQMFGKVRGKIFSYGFDAIPELEKACENTPDKTVQERINLIIRDIQQQQLFIDLADWARFGSDDLLKGYLIVSRYQNPDLDTHAITRQIGCIVQEVWMELNANLTALEKIKVINHVIFDINKFGGNKSDINAPDNYYLKNLFDSRKGNPVSLGMLYMLIAQSLKIPIFGIDLPRHFVLAYVDETFAADNKNVSRDQILFYLNPFNKGAVFTANEIELYIKQLGIKLEDSHFLPCSNITVLKKLIEGLINAYQELDEFEIMRDLSNLWRAIDVL